jgi:hypothetical protein
VVHSLDRDVDGHAWLDYSGRASWGSGYMGGWWVGAVCVWLDDGVPGDVAIEIGRACLPQPGCMSWMVTAEASLSGPSVGIGINGRLACRKTPGRCIGGCDIGVGLAVDRRGLSRSGRGALGLQMLCTTISSSPLSTSVPARIWKGLLLRVTL